MMSQIPQNFQKLDKAELNKEILRVAIIAEYDAINLYGQLAAISTKSAIKKTLKDIAREEKTHVGEFQALLLNEDAEQKRELKKGQAEVDELVAKIK